MAFSFGATTSSSTGGLFGGFGANKATTTTASSFGGFGTKTTTSGGLFGSTSTGFGAKTSTASGGGGLFGTSTGFGAKTSTATGGGGLFGSTGFGAKTSTATGGGLFGSTGFATKTTSAASGGLFSSNTMFNSKPAATGGGLFGSSTTGGTSAFNFSNKIGTTPANQQQQSQQQEDSKALELLATARALSSPVLFGDVKDEIITKFNQLQAYWGTGRGFYTKEGACINFTPQSYFCRFKAVGYSLMPTSTDDKGFVALVCNKKQAEMEQVGSKQLSQAIHKIIGNSSPNINVQVESIRHLPDNKCEMTIYVEEQSSVTGVKRRVFASELHQFLQQANIKQQLQQQLHMETCMPRVQMSAEQINRILSTPPAGISNPAARMRGKTKINRT